jgi:hypothetical protein
MKYMGKSEISAGNLLMIAGNCAKPTLDSRAKWNPHPGAVSKPLE